MCIGGRKKTQTKREAKSIIRVVINFFLQRVKLIIKTVKCQYIIVSAILTILSTTELSYILSHYSYYRLANENKRGIYTWIRTKGYRIK